MTATDLTCRLCRENPVTTPGGYCEHCRQDARDEAGRADR